MAQSPYYASHTWPPYNFREFPKQVGNVIVHDEDEELAALQAMPDDERPTPPVNVGEMQRQIAALMAQVAALTAPAPVAPRPYHAPQSPDAPHAPDEREDLWALAAERGIDIDRRWGLERLRLALQ